ncbi:MAG: hypothetical protein WC229_00960 [Candidatus Paceibacterota bacterium]|jgi:hypothetical protein
MDEKKDPVHFTQSYDVLIKENALDFFDLNLKYDSRLFIDPFLLKKSSIVEEQKLFERFGDFFRFAYDKSLLINKDESEYENLKTLLNFHEPKEIGLGYTEDSNKGAGPGPAFAKILFNFFIGNSAKRLIKEEGLFPDGKFNPVTLQLFIDDLGPDGLSDITANLIMDYLIEYTQIQCKLLGIPLKKLPLNNDGFDFENMEWKGGSYYDLPENPLKEGEAVILVPKRFLRATETENDHINTKVRGILSQDSELSKRFSMFVNKNISDISIEDVRSIFLQEESVFKSYIKALTQTRDKPYDFEKDILRILSIKTYSSYFEDNEIPKDIKTCKDLLEKTLEFIDIFKDHCSVSDGWKEMWVMSDVDTEERPQREAVFGRIFRGMGFAYFRNLTKVTFLPEVGTGNGSLDFAVIYNDCRIAIELKRLDNSSPKGVPPILSYMHGIKRQLPEYAYLIRAVYAIYITGQHFTSRNKPQGNHNNRVIEIQETVPLIEKEMKRKRKEFKSLHYINIDLSPKPSASGI